MIVTGAEKGQPFQYG